MAQALRTSLQAGGLTQGGLRPGLGGDNIFASSALDLNFGMTKSLGDLVTFTRASSGTYVGSDGLLKTATTNLLLRSEEIGASPWGTNVSGSVTYTANAIASPTGAVTADRVTATADFAGPNQFISAVSGLNYAFSFYIKAVTPGALDAIRMECFSGRFAQFNITTRVFSGVNAAITPSSVSVGDGWVRVQLLFTAPSTGSLAVAVYANTSSDFYLWGAQLEQSATVGEYIPTTSTINSAPRFDHNPTTGESLGLLVEEQRTNLCLQSEDLGTTWTATRATVSTNQALSPSGTTTADKVILDSTANNSHFAQTVPTITANSTITFSVYAKAAEWQYLRVEILGNVSTADLVTRTFNVSTGSAVAAGSTTGVAVLSASGIQDAGNGWYRVFLTGVINATDTAVRIRLMLGAAAGGALVNGDGVSGLYLWGAQLEAGAFPTSYIPTTTATATRSADVASITGSSYSSWASVGQGTIFANAMTADPSGVFPCAASINDTTTSNRIQIGRTNTSTAALRVFVTSGGATTVNGMTVGSTSALQLGRVAFAYATDDFGGAANGALATPDTSGAVPVTTQLQIGNAVGSGSLNGCISRLTYWPQRLSNTTLQQITQ